MPRKKATKSKVSIDVKSHTLVPKHSKLSEKDKKELFEKYMITVNDLPGIAITDPVIVDLDVEEGDVIRIERRSPTAGITLFYRGVINDES